METAARRFFNIYIYVIVIIYFVLVHAKAGGRSEEGREGRREAQGGMLLIVNSAYA